MRADKRLASVLLQSQPSQATERIQVPEGADDTIRHIGNPAAVVWATFATPPGSRPSPPPPRAGGARRSSGVPVAACVLGQRRAYRLILAADANAYMLSACTRVCCRKPGFAQPLPPSLL